MTPKLYISQGRADRLIITEHADPATYVCGPYTSTADAMNEINRRTLREYARRDAWCIAWGVFVGAAVVLAAHLT